MFKVEELAASKQDMQNLLDYYAKTHPNQTVLDKYLHVYRNMEYRYVNSIRDRMIHGSNLVYFTASPFIIYFGFSSCHPNEKQYSKSVGRNIALLRLLYTPISLKAEQFVDAYYEYMEYENFETVPLLLRRSKALYNTNLENVPPETLGVVLSSVILEMGEDTTEDLLGLNSDVYFKESNEAIAVAFREMVNEKWAENISKI